MSPPSQALTSVRADYSRVTTYQDPTGEQAVSNLLNGGGPFQITAENGSRIFVNKDTLDIMLAGCHFRVSRNGKLWADA